MSNPTFCQSKWLDGSIPVGQSHGASTSKSPPLVEDPFTLQNLTMMLGAVHITRPCISTHAQVVRIDMREILTIAAGESTSAYDGVQVMTDE